VSLAEPLPTESWPLRRRCDTIGRFWGLHWGGLQLVILRERGERDLADFKYRILRRHQRAHFLPGVKKLGIPLDLPPAVIAGRYHYLSNLIGGLRMEYVEESPRKVWIRYLAPAWSFPGLSLFAVPGSVQRAMFAGWHPHNGPSLGSSRLRFVVTKVYQEGEPYDEGYFEEAETDLAPDERIRYQTVTRSPDFDPARAPGLDPAAWPEERLCRARRNFARDYLADGIRTALEGYGVHGAAGYLAQAARLCAVQFFDEFREAFGIAGTDARALARQFACLADLADERPAVEQQGTALRLRRMPGLFREGDVAPEIYAALFEFARVAAKIFNPRVRVTLGAVPHEGAPTEEWRLEDVTDRTF
jgi:hypothetical protein